MKRNDPTMLDETESFDGYGDCADVTRNMVAKDPSLTRVRGFYHCPQWGRRAHWWLKDATGRVLDPTAAQFPSMGLGSYEEYDALKHPTPVGRCMQCGDETFEHPNYCGDTCATEIERYYGSFNDTPDIVGECVNRIGKENSNN